MPKINQAAVPGEALFVCATAIVITAGLFEWVVISPEDPVHAVFRVCASVITATLALVAFRRT